MPEIAMFTAMAAASTVSANGNGAKIRVNMLATVSPHNAATPVMEFQCIPWRRTPPYATSQLQCESMDAGAMDSRAVPIQVDCQLCRLAWQYTYHQYTSGIAEDRSGIGKGGLPQTHQCFSGIHL